MPFYLVSHRHSHQECRAVFASWHGFDSPLRGEVTMSSCLQGDHGLWWKVEAASAEEALALLPPFVADRCEVTQIREVPIP